MRGAKHGIRIAATWLILTIVAEVLIGIVGIPSPAQSKQALGEHQTVYMLFYLGAPIFIFVWVLFAYNLIVFRRGGAGDVEDPPDRPDSRPILLIWAGLSFTIVLFMAGWGTFTLNEITKANGPHPLVVQVIGQEWEWNYRYPTYGGMETRDLVLPVSTPIEFHITSLDVVHSFWIYHYDVKEDAVPGNMNIAYFEAKQTGSSTPSGKNWVVCNELCGLWHSYMHSRLAVETKSAFANWATTQEKYQRSIGFLKLLPKYADVYYPQLNGVPAAWPPAPQDQSP